MLSHQMDTLSDDVKSIRDSLKNILQKSEMEDFIKTTITEIVPEMNESMDVTISMKVEEQTKAIKAEMNTLESENEQLRKDVINLKTELKTQNKKMLI